jgi:antitoxin CcdA
MTAAKRKISVSIDADLVDELERGDDGLSKQVNDAVRETLERRRRFVQLEKWLASLDSREGKVSARLLAKYEELLG